LDSPLKAEVATEGEIRDGRKSAGPRGFLIRHPMPTTTAAGAVNLIATLPDVPLRTLDAMHLVIAREIDASILATADRIMAAGAHEMGFSVVRFFR
jgi:hypothetical protein